MGKGTDNLRYRQMEVEEGTFLPEWDIEYPEQDPFEHTVEVVYNSDRVALDETYPYLDDSFRYKLNRWLNSFLLYTIVMPGNRLRFGLRIEGKKELKKYRHLFRDGAMTVCNHVYRLDMVCILDAMKFKRIWFPIYGEHIMGKDGWYMRYVGGIPVAQTKAGMRAFNEAFDELHRRKQWLHVFPESCSWRHYVPIRPFQKGAFTMAYRYGMPVIPCCISYRPRTGIYKLFDKADVPLVTLHIGTPIIPDTSKPRKDEVERLLVESHSQMVKMAGIKNNPWPAQF
ncbi:MAG: lysophospholipid acyltransferase family protein [Candidatus Cryptobacteroides sp.]